MWFAVCKLIRWETQGLNKEGEKQLILGVYHRACYVVITQLTLHTIILLITIIIIIICIILKYYHIAGNETKQPELPSIRFLSGLN